ISGELVRQVNIPVFLAGGLNPGNVQEAIQAVKPYGVDICSGVRSNGKLDVQKLDAFVRAVKSL
ncbi:MAG TPA: phosphoribosylanthranilate isomerase, partial [Ferruginibacter sp.]|nr:phosphoribosylanthranilate isomerase [Ferruginibacter sp.]